MLPKTRSNNFKFNTFECPQYIFEALQALKPPEPITVSEWAQKYRVLDERSSAMPGHWSNNVTPYLIGIMDAFNDWQTEKIVFVKPTQVGGTESLLNILGYVVAQDPAPTLIVEPSIVMAESFAENRLIPMFKKSPATRAKFYENKSSMDELQFDGMYMALSGANSPASLASRPCKVVVLDETDKYPQSISSTSKEADPISLAIERTKTFNNRKVFMCSTPTVETGAIWKQKEKCDIEKHYFVPCPHCGKKIEFIFDYLKFPKATDDPDNKISYLERAEFAYYECQNCGGKITDADKKRMLLAGEWREVKRRTKFSKSVAFWLNTLYSPFTSFADIAKNFLLSKGDVEAMRNFYNSWLALPFKENTKATTEATIKAHENDLPEFILPDWCKLLVLGVDTQEAYFVYSVYAFGVGGTAHLVTRGEALSFEQLDNILNLEYKFQNGEKKLIDLCCIDSGGNRTDAIYNYALARRGFVLPVKGSSTAMLSHYKLSSINKVGVATGIQLVILDTFKYKEQVNAKLQTKLGERGGISFFNGVDVDFCKQMTAEEKVAERSSNGAVKYSYRLKTSHAANHYWDCCIYAHLAADILGVRSLFLQEQEEQQAQALNYTPPANRQPSDLELLDQTPVGNDWNQLQADQDYWDNLQDWLD